MRAARPRPDRRGPPLRPQPRVWLPASPPGKAALGLAFPARRGAAQFDAPSALVLRADGAPAPAALLAWALPSGGSAAGGGSGGPAAAEARARAAVEPLRDAARAAWLMPRHPGWRRLAGDGELVRRRL
jgi:hypothetical protein